VLIVKCGVRHVETTNLAVDPRNSAAMSKTYSRVLLITANVGSIFEDVRTRLQMLAVLAIGCVLFQLVGLMSSRDRSFGPRGPMKKNG